MDSVEKSDDEFIAIRPEWTTVDRILASRYADNLTTNSMTWVLTIFTLYGELFVLKSKNTYTISLIYVMTYVASDFISWHSSFFIW
jgi:hypothetical protein